MRKYRSKRKFIMARKIRDVTVVLLLLGLLGAQLSAQDTRNTTQLGIIVTDKSNAYITGAQIKICPHAGVLPKMPQTYQNGTLQLNLVPGSSRFHSQPHQSVDNALRLTGVTGTPSAARTIIEV